MEQDFYVVPSLDLPDVFFVIREYGAQIRVVVKNNEFYPNHILQKREVEHFKKKIKNGLN